MPFRVEIEHIHYATERLALITGRVVEGGYAGSEVVRFRGEDGSDYESCVQQHSLAGDLVWPVVAGSQVELTLTFPLIAGVRVDRGFGVHGLGAVMRAPAHLELPVAVLSEPCFWACELGHHLGDYVSEDGESPEEYFFHVSNEAVAAFYTQTFDVPWRRGTWPRIVAELGGGLAYEYEWAAGTEYQTRHWVRVAEQRSLLGYYSGHFSTPCARPEEIRRLALALAYTPWRHMPLLLSAASFSADGTHHAEALASDLVPTLPGVREERRAELVDALAAHLHLPDAHWREVPGYGWVNAWPYSQRNPESAMSIASANDFSAIARFFDALPAFR